MARHPCPDCGPAPTSHAAEYLGAIVDTTFASALAPFERFANAVLSWFRFFHGERIALPLMRACAAFGIGRVLTKPDANDSLRTKCLWEAAELRGIRLFEFALLDCFRDWFVAITPAHELRAFDGLPRPLGRHSDALDWMDNKAIMRRKFEAAGIPVAAGGVAVSERRARKMFASIRKPAITKPNLGSRSRHTTTHLMEEQEFLLAFWRAKQLSPWVVIEEELQGMVFRGTVIGGRVVGVVRREPPHVRGDGRHTVQELVDQENQNPKRQGPIFHLLPTGPEARAELTRQGFSWENVPSAGAFVTLGQKTSRGVGGSTTELFEKTHPETIRLLERIAAVLKDPLVGIDFVLQDIERPWREQPRSGVIECNSLPFLDLHCYPLFGTPRDAAGALWELVFPSSR